MIHFCDKAGVYRNCSEMEMRLITLNGAVGTVLVSNRGLACC